MAAVMVVEDGTGLSTSNSYVSIADMKAYWDNMGYIYTTLSDTQIDVLLIKNTRIIDGTYGRKFPGVRGSSTQALEWPRTGAKYLDGYSINSAIVPLEVVAAVCESAYVSNTGIDLQPINDKKGIKEYAVKVDIIEESTTYESGSGIKRPESTMVKDALSRLIRFGAYGGVGILRI